jgi:hypothetical protein
MAEVSPPLTDPEPLSKPAWTACRNEAQADVGTTLDARQSCRRARLRLIELALTAVAFVSARPALLAGLTGLTGTAGLNGDTGFLKAAPLSRVTVHKTTCRPRIEPTKQNPFRPRIFHYANGRFHFLGRGSILLASAANRTKSDSHMAIIVCLFEHISSELAYWSFERFVTKLIEPVTYTHGSIQ